MHLRHGKISRIVLWKTQPQRLQTYLQTARSHLLLRPNWTLPSRFCPVHHNSSIHNPKGSRYNCAFGVNGLQRINLAFNHQKITTCKFRLLNFTFLRNLFRYKYSCDVQFNRQFSGWPLQIWLKAMLTNSQKTAEDKIYAAVKNKNGKNVVPDSRTHRSCRCYLVCGASLFGIIKPLQFLPRFKHQSTIRHT